LSASRHGNKNNTEHCIDTDYYLKLSKLSKYTENYAHLLNNASLKLKFFVFLNSILKNNSAKFYDFGENENPLMKLEKILFHNFEQMTAIFNNELIEKKLSFEDEFLLNELNYSLLNLLDTFSKVFTYEESLSIDLAKKLLNLLEKTYWPSCSFIKSNLNIEEISSPNCGNVLIISRILIRLLRNKQLNSINELKKDLLSFLTNENFVRFIWLIIIESQNINHELLAHEIFDSLKEISKTSCDSNKSFSMENLLKIKHKMKRELKTNDKSSIVQLKYPIANNFKSETQENFLHEIKNSKETRLTKLLEFYDHKIKEQIRQQTQMMNTLNEGFSNSLLSEMEHQKLRGRF
jgi:hypothetical protein